MRGKERMMQDRLSSRPGSPGNGVLGAGGWVIYAVCPRKPASTLVSNAEGG